jgi:hypothetical protein
VTRDEAIELRVLQRKLDEILANQREIIASLREPYGDDDPLETEVDQGLREIAEFLSTAPQPRDRGCGVRVFLDDE